jgi:hypothetical protein
MTRRITQLIEEQNNRSKLFSTRDPDVEVARTLEDPQKIEVPIPDKEYQQREVTILKEDKNHNKKRHTKTNLTGKKARI